MDNELISVIVPIFNTERYLERCIDSIINQTYHNLEIILIDDGSTDNSLKICNIYKEKDARIEVVHSENRGVSHARNLGIDIAKGEYIAFVDSDDYIEKNMYNELYIRIKEDETEMAVCNFSNNKSLEELPIVITQFEFLSYILDKDKFRGFLTNKLYKRNLIDKQRLDEKIYICEDLMFNCEYALKCKSCSIIDKKLYNYELREDSAVNDSQYNPKRKTSLDVYERLIELYRINAYESMNKLYCCYIKEYSVIIYQLTKINANEEIKDIKKSLKQTLRETKKYCNCWEIIEIKMYAYFPYIIQNLRKIYNKRKKGKT